MSESEHAEKDDPTTSRRARKCHGRRGSVKTGPKSGRPRAKVTPRNNSKMRKRIAPNPQRSITKKAKSLDMSRRSMRRLLDETAHQSKQAPICHQIGTAKQTERAETAAILSKEIEGTNNVIIWSDEKMFYADEAANLQRTRFLVPKINEDKSLRVKTPSQTVSPNNGLGGSYFKWITNASHLF